MGRRVREAGVALAILLVALAAPGARAAPRTPRLCAASLARAAEVERAGDLATARATMSEALERDPGCSDAHARLERATGRAARPAGSEPDAALRIAVQHPYDPRALVAAARSAVAAGRPELALPLLEKVVWLGDVEPGATAEALALLAAVDPEAPARAVPVHVYADASARADEGWRFSLRTRWANVSKGLARVLGSRLVLLGIEPFEAGPGADILSGFASLARVEAPEYGIVAGMLGASDAPAAARSGEVDRRVGAAEFLGRRLVVRMEPGAPGERLLAHEILHLYGAVHVPASSGSLMNATGDSQVVDAANRRILMLTRERVFGPGGVERNLLPGLDLRAAIDAWGGALRLDLALRGPELARAVAASGLTPGAAGPDPHLGDVAHWVAALLVAEGRRDEGALLLDAASALHGSQTAAGRAEAERARGLRATPE
jgi:hypothetical protein